MNFPKREELLLRTVLALPKINAKIIKILCFQTESFEDGVGLDDLIFEGDLLFVLLFVLLLCEHVLLSSTNRSEIGNDL